VTAGEVADRMAIVLTIAMTNSDKSNEMATNGTVSIKKTPELCFQ
jgi:hypothetical protein